MSHKFAFVLVLLCGITLALWGQTPIHIRGGVGTASMQNIPASSEIARQAIHSALGAVTGKTMQALRDVSLSGAAEFFAGSTHETGTATLKAKADGSSAVDLVFPSGPRREVRRRSSMGPFGIWARF